MSIFDQLAAPIDPARVSWRVGSTTKTKDKGMALAYIDARDVMARLDEAVTPGCWQDRYEVHGSKTICYLSIKVGDEWVTKADGAGDSDVEAEKGAISDAFKRAAVKWGIGRYLYDIDSPWVELEQRGSTHVIAKGEYAKLRAVLAGKAAPAAIHAPEASKAAPAPPRPSKGLIVLSAELKRQNTPEAVGKWWAENKPAIEELTQTQIDDLKTAAQDRKRELARISA